MKQALLDVGYTPMKEMNGMSALMETDKYNRSNSNKWKVGGRGYPIEKGWDGWKVEGGTG